MKAKNFLKLALIFAMIISLCLAIAACGGSPAANGQGGTDNESANDFPDVTISYDSPFGSTHPFSLMDQKWAEDLKARANINVDMYYSYALLSHATPYHDILSGAADSCYALNGSEKDHFIVQSGIQAFYSYGAKELRPVYETLQELLEQCEPLAAEYAGVVSFGLRTAGGPLCLVTHEPVRKLEDLKGMTIRVANDTMFAVVSEYGGEPIRMDIPEMIEAMEKNIIDGVLLPVECIMTMNFAEKCKYVTEMRMIDPYGVERYINEDSFNKFTDKQKEVFMEVGKEIDFAVMENAYILDEEAIKFGDSLGVEIITLTDEEYDRINKVLADFAQGMIVELNNKGYDGQGIFDLTRSLLEKNIAEYES